jgi:hypothetical protein
MKAQIRAKTRNRGRDWAVFRRPDKKKRVVGDLVGFMARDALKLYLDKFTRLKPYCISFGCLMFLSVPSLPMNLLPGEDNREAWLLEGYPQSYDKINDLSDGGVDSDVPPSHC